MKKLALSIISLIISILLLIVVIYAWFVDNSSINNIIITTGNVDVSAELYRGVDFNLDGELDKGDDGKDILQPILEYFSISDICPGDVVTYELKIENIGSYPGILSVSFGNFSGALQKVLVNDAVNVGGYPARYTGSSMEQPLNAEAYLLSIGEICYVRFTLRFALLSELKTIAPEDFGQEVTDLNDYQYPPSGSFDGRFGMTITVSLTQTT